jgi:multiple sugar transport system permease protein
MRPSRVASYTRRFDHPLTSFDNISALVTWGILTAQGFWNDLFWPLIVLSDRPNLTLPVGLLVLSQSSYIQRGLAFVGGFLAAAPPLIFYFIFQRRIIQGVATSGLAGRQQIAEIG